MRICPVCKTTYDDPEMLFCINDGTRLIEIQTSAETPSNISQPANETAKQPNAFVVSVSQSPPETKVSPIAPSPTNVRAKQNSNKFLFPLLAVLLLFMGAAIGVGAYYFSSANRQVAQSNQNAVTNINTSLTNNSTANLISNANLGLNANSNQNANAKPSPKPSPSIANRNQNVNVNVNANQTIVSSTNAANANLANAQPSPAVNSSPAVSASPQPSRPPVVSGGLLNGRATSLPKPAYPPAARAVRANGLVTVQVTIDEDGNVISAAATSGNALLREAAVQAARQARFQPTILAGQPVKTTGVINYNFVSEP